MIWLVESAAQWHTVWWRWRRRAVMSQCKLCSVCVFNWRDCKCISTTDQSFSDLLLEILQKLNIDVKNCIGNSTNGASNMQGQYSGFSKHLSTVCPDQLHVWYYGHVLNLVICECDAKKSCIAVSLSC